MVTAGTSGVAAIVSSTSVLTGRGDQPLFSYVVVEVRVWVFPFASVTVWVIVVGRSSQA